VQPLPAGIARAIFLKGTRLHRAGENVMRTALRFGLTMALRPRASAAAISSR
jgi:hypothetical protein